MRYVFALLLLLPQLICASVVGIDYGTDWFKVSIVKPGVPLDIVLNRESKRKTSSIVALRNNVRHMGSDAVALATKVPASTYPALKNLLGKTFDHALAKEYRAVYQNKMIKNETRGTVAFTIGDETFSIEEVVAMQLAHARRQAEKYGDEKVFGAVITVPPYFNQFERQALLDAAELAGLKVLRLMNDETAVALNYAMTRAFNETQHHIFYDMGAGSTIAALVTFYQETIKEGKLNRTVPVVEVKGFGYDPSLGGFVIDARLAKYLQEQFIEKNKKKLTSNVDESGRAKAKFMKEANRVKQILSANTETFASIENVIDEIDFKLKVTRAELEEMCKDVFARVESPIKQVLEMTKLKVEDINSLVVVGGGVRIPAVQEILKNLVGEERIAKNINGDEAAVLGAGFMAAAISKQYKVREIKVKDVNYAQIAVEYATEAGKTLKTGLMTPSTMLGAKKLMNFKRKSDFDFSLVYNSTGKKILTAKVSGLTAAVEKHKEKLEKDPKVKALIELTESGLIQIHEATGTFEVEEKPASLADTVFSFLGGGSKKDDKEAKEGEAAAEEVIAPENNSTEAAANKTDSTPKIKSETFNLTLAFTYPTIPPLDETTKSALKARFAKMDNEDTQRRLREEARNNLESFIYKAKEFLSEDRVQDVTTEEQRNALNERLDKDGDWLYEDGETAKKEEFAGKMKELKTLYDPIQFRVDESKKRVELVQSLQSVLTEVPTWIKNASETIKNLEEAKKNANETDEYEPEEPVHKVAELDDLSKTVEETNKWLGDMTTKQDALAKHDTPVLVSKDLEIRLIKLSQQYGKLSSRKKKPRKKKAKSTSSSASSSSTTSSSSSSPASESTTVSSKTEESTQESTKPEATPAEEHEKDEL